MANVTLRIDDDELRAARKIAIDRNTTLNGILRDYVHKLVASESEDRERAFHELERLWAEWPLQASPRTWTREELHER